MSLIQGNLAKSAVSGFYNGVIEGSARFDNSGSRLQRTMGSGGSRTKWTASAWLKRAERTGQSFWLSSRNSEIINIGFQNDNFYMFLRGDGDKEWRSNAKYRDPSAWYHVVVAFDTTQSTASNRVKVYINGEQITSWSSQPTVSQNYTTAMCEAQGHCIGDQQNIYDSPFPGYMAEVILIDGQQLAPTSFGESKNGVWIPKAYSGSYGTNGFRLDFSQSLTADQSGNGNNWTAVNMGSTDLMLDTPENSFAVLNPNYQSIEWGNATLSEGNLKYVGSGQKPMAHSTFPSYSGKWYAEFYVASGTHTGIGVTDTNWRGGYNAPYGRDDFWWETNDFKRAVYQGYNGNMNYGNTVETSYGSSYSNSIIGIALDADNNKITMYKNGVSQGQYTLPAKSNPSHGWLISVCPGNIDSHTYYANFGQDSSFAGTKTAQGNTDSNGYGDFYYTPPSGYLAQCTANLELSDAMNPALDASPQDHFAAVTYTGNNTTNDINTVGFEPTLTWISARSAGQAHSLFDQVRGARAMLWSNSGDDEYVNASGTSLVSWDSEGFNLGANGAGAPTNSSGTTYVAHNWKANGSSTSSNTNGSITSTVSANTDAGFSVVSYTGNGTSSSIGHGLNEKPDCILLKERSGADYWWVNHVGLPNQSTYGLFLNTSEGQQSRSYWGNTTPTSSVFYVDGSGVTNQSGGTYIAYCFHSVEGFSKFGEYYGTGSSTDGTFVYTGFRPAYVLIKQINTSRDWHVYDSARDPYNQVERYSMINNMLSEYSGDNQFDFYSNGFKLRSSNTGSNASGGTYIYMAFAENPFKYANAR